MSVFKAAIGACGLSHREAADYLGVSLDSVKSWSIGRVNPPMRVWVLLASLFEQIQLTAYEAAEVLDLDGVPAPAFNSTKAEIADSELPAEGARHAARAMALLSAITEQAALLRR